MPIQILIADDHGVVRAGLRALLNAEPDLQVVGEAACGKEAVRFAVQRQPDVVLMDISMPELDGIEATRRLAEQAPQVRVVLLTVHEDAALLREAIRAGASGYVIKRAVESELISAVRASVAGDLYVHPSMTRSLLDDQEPVSANSRALDRLTPREIEVLCLIAEGHTNTQIAKLLHLSPRTVETHRANIRAKLHLDSRADLVRFSIRHGLLADSY
jgi:two-component system response regulator NreC